MSKIILIGATSGIAQAIAARLAQQGAELYLMGRSSAKLDLLAADLTTRYGQHGVRVETRAFDFDDFALHHPAVEAAAKALGKVDAAYICHGTLGDQAACECNFALAEQEFRNNCLSPISFLTHLGNLLEAQGSGTLVAISSVAGDRGRQSNYVYGAAKAGLTAFLQGLRNRLYKKGVYVVTVKPGFVDTPMTAAMPRSPLTASPDAVARDIIRAAQRGTPVLYTPWFWQGIMLIIKAIPERLFRRLTL